MNESQTIGILLLFVLIFGVPYIIYLFLSPIWRKKKNKDNDKKSDPNDTK